MRIFAGAILLVIATSAATDLSAQTRAESRTQRPLPADRDTWVVEVSTSGGLTGRGRGGIVVEWDGALTCTPPMTACSRVTTPDALVRLQSLVTALSADDRVEPTRMPCSDCFVTTMVVTRRAPDGSLVVLSYHWNDVELATVPAAVKQLHAEVMRVR